MTDSLPLIGEADPEFELLLMEDNDPLRETLRKLIVEKDELRQENAELRERLTYVTPVEPFNGPMWLIYKDAHGKQHKQPWEDLGTGSLYDPYTEDDMEIVGWWTEDN